MEAGKQMVITVYGDSILKGVRYENGQFLVFPFWEERLSQYLGAIIRNRSHFGFTIRHALRSIRRCADKPIKEKELTILEMGGNDCDYDWGAISAAPDARHLCKTPPEIFVSNYREAITLLRDSGRIPVMATLPPIHSERYLDYICRDGLSRERILYWLGRVETIFNWQKTYSCLVCQLAREERVPLIDIRSAFSKSGIPLEELLSADGIHPSDKGQELIYEALESQADQWYHSL